MEIFKFDAVGMSEELWGILRRLGEMWPDELRMAEIVELNCFSNRAAAIVAHLGGERDNYEAGLATRVEERVYHETHEIHEKEDQPAQDAGAPICLNCQQPFERRRGGNKFCSEVCKKVYYRAKRQPKKEQEGQAGDAHSPSRIYLDVQKGDVLSIHEVNRGLRAGEYAPGRRFRRGDARLYVVEQRVTPAGTTRWRLKQVYGQDGER